MKTNKRFTYSKFYNRIRICIVKGLKWKIKDKQLRKKKKKKMPDIDKFFNYMKATEKLLFL